MLRYIELKTGYSDNGPAWVARVKLSKSRRTVYFNGKALKQGGRGTYYDLQTRGQYWISAVKKRGTDRHWAGSGIVFIEVGVVAEYLALVEQPELDTSRFKVIPDFAEPDPSQFTALQNKRLER